MEKSKDTFLDFSGVRTGVTNVRKFYVSLAASVAIYFLFALTNPIAAYGELASKALGFFIAAILFMVTSGVPLAPIALLVATLGTMIGFWPWSTVSGKLGSSQLYNMMGMLIVASGCEFTPFGRRVSYWILKKFGQKPVRMVIFVGISAAVLSSVISNVAIIILYSSVINGLLLAMGEKPGESHIGKAIMCIIPMCACVGGMALFCGSPTGNGATLSFMTGALGDESYAATFAQWACISVPTFLIAIVPCLLVYIKFFRVNNQSCVCLPEEHYDALLKELGPIGGSEIRWIIYVVAMVTAMLLGMKGPYAALLFAAITIFPVIGVAKSGDVIKKLPWNALVAICILPLLGNLITDTGISDWISAVVNPLLGNGSPFTLCLLAALIMAILCNLLVNAMMGTMALVMTVAAPICVSLGYNPTIVLLPAAFAGSYFWCMGANQYVAINKDYGWWEMKDPIIPGFVVAIMMAVISSVVACTLGPVFGMSLYL